MLVYDKPFWVQENLAKNPDTKAETLYILSGSTRKTVLELLTHNPNTPVKALQHLAKDPDYEVRIGVARHKNTDSATLDSLLDSVENYRKDRRLVTALLRSPKVSAKALLLIQENIPSVFFLHVNFKASCATALAQLK